MKELKNFNNFTINWEEFNDESKQKYLNFREMDNSHRRSSLWNLKENRKTTSQASMNFQKVGDLAKNNQNLFNKHVQ